MRSALPLCRLALLCSTANCTGVNKEPDYGRKLPVDLGDRERIIVSLISMTGSEAR